VGSIIDSNGGGHYVQLKIDAQDVMHVAYIDNNVDSYIRYGYRTRFNSWTLVTASTSAAGGAVDLILDNDDRPRFTYKGTTGTVSGLRLASRNSDGGWSNETIDGVNSVGQTASVVQNPTSGTLRAVYTYTNGLMTALKPSDTWSRSSLVSFGERPRVVIDAAQQTWLSFYDADNDNLYFGAPNTSNWSSNIVASTSHGLAHDLVVDDAGGVHFAYVGDDGVYYGSYSNGGFNFDRIPSSGGGWKGLALVIDHTGLPHIAYSRPGDRELRYLHKRADGSWFGSYASRIGSSCDWLDIDVDSQNRAVIVFLDSDDVVPRIVWQE
jgi:hypothetical protein